MPGWFDEQMASAPAASGTSAQDPRAYFQSLFPGATLTPEQLASKEADLQRAGIRLLGPNAKGQRTKIELPGGQIVDVIGGAGSGSNRNQWLVDSGGGAQGGMVPGMYTGGGQYPLASLSGVGLMAPWTTPFKARSPEEITKDPAYQFQLKQGAEALQRSAAARGTLLTGGTLKDLEGYAQGLASTFNDKYYNRDIGEYQMANGIFNQNQQNQFGRLAGVAGIGADTASGYGNTAAGLITGAGNATAAGQAGSASAWANGLQGAGNTAAGTMMAYPWYKQAPVNYGSPYQGPVDYGYGAPPR
jgi:hypothetical protein